ncbi:MAG: GNAT family N-acetyltransferase [Nocardioidaceae bacterium]
MQIFVETERLVLRRFSAADEDHLVDLDSDPEVMRFLTGGKPTPRHVIRDEILPELLGEYQRGDGCGRWAAIEKATAEFVGWFALRVPPRGTNAEVELGYRLRRSVWGHGYGAEGSAAVIAKGFRDLGVQRVYAETMAVNTASRRVLGKAGLRYVRTFHLSWPEPIPGVEHGEVEYARDKATWQAQT